MQVQEKMMNPDSVKRSNLDRLKGWLKELDDPTTSEGRKNLIRRLLAHLRRTNDTKLNAIQNGKGKETPDVGAEQA
jgi:hypothetical protein